MTFCGWGRTSLADNLPRLHNYSEALHRYDKTEPLRAGDDKGLVPLGWNRRYKRSQILKVETLQGNAIFCRFWETDVVKFYENGTIHLDVGCWHSPTTLMFLEGVLGNRFTRYKGKIYYKQPATDKYFLIHSKGGLVLDDGGSPINPLPEYAKVLNRARWKDLNQKVKPFSLYAQDMAKFLESRQATDLMDEFKSLIRTYGEEYWIGICPIAKDGNLRLPFLGVGARAIRYDRGSMTPAREKFLDRMLEASHTNDPEKMYPLFFVLHASASEQRWTGNGYVSECSPDRLKKFLTELLKFGFCEGLFDEVVQPLGTLVADSNAKYFINRTF